MVPVDERGNRGLQWSRRPDNDAVHRRIRWGIYAATGATAFFLVGFVASWQVALSKAVEFDSNLGGLMIAMYVIAALFIALAVAAFVSATRVV